MSMSLEKLEALFKKGEPYNKELFDEHCLGVITSPHFKLLGLTFKDILKLHKYLAIKNTSIDELLKEL